MEAEEFQSKKKIWSFEDMVRVMKPTPEELKYRKQKSKESDFVQKYSKLFKCTKCQSNLKSDILSNEKVPTHPCLGVLMCQKCCNYYEDGEFSLDSDGEDKYCRWCGEGGTIFVCSKCVCGFCAACIKRHFGWKHFREVQKDENWLCFFCNQKPLWDQRFICSLAIELSESAKSKKLDDLSKETTASSLETPNGENQSAVELENSTPDSVLKSDIEESKILTPNDDSDLEVPIKRRRINSTSPKERSTSFESYSTSEVKTSTPRFVLKIVNKKKKNQRSDDNSEQRKSISSKSKKDKNVSSSFESIKSNALNELRKILLLSKQQMNLGMSWSEKTIEKLKSLNINTPEELEKECQIVKWFLSTLSTYLVEFSNSVERVEKKLHSTEGSKSQQQLSASQDHTDYTKILQILGFFSNQIKTFMEKGISLPDILGAEMYDDPKIIGIKKNPNPSDKTPDIEISKPSAGSCNLKNNDNDPEKNKNNAESNENAAENNADNLENSENDAENNANNTERNENDAEHNANNAESSECRVTEEPQVTESEKNTDELPSSSFLDEALEKDNDLENIAKEEDEDSLSIVADELNDFKIVDREDIRQILAILENA